MARSIRILLLATGVFALTITAFAQGTTGNLLGAVSANGFPLADVQVSASSDALLGTRTTTTDVNGSYVFAGLSPGLYRVEFNKGGMKAVAVRAEVTLAATTRVNAIMLPAPLVEEAVVEANRSPAVETAEVQTNFDAALIGALAFGRTYTAIASLAPGVVPSGVRNMSIAGAPTQHNLYLVNGAVVNENVSGAPHDLFIESAIQEETVLTGAVPAEFGRFLGGVVTAVTRSGGNDLRGAFRINFSNPSWTEKTQFPDEPDHLDEMNEFYELSLGGPVVRERLWFFTAGRYTENSQDRILTLLPGETIAPTPFSSGTENIRYEVKLTGQLSPSQTLVGSYLRNSTRETNFMFTESYEASAIDPERSLPSDFVVARYMMSARDNLLIEAAYSAKTFTYEDSGGEHNDFARGTWGLDYTTGAFFGAPVFCGVCLYEQRDNDAFNLKATWIVPTAALGSHTLVAGGENFDEQRLSDNHQSASDFDIIVLTAPERGPHGEIFPVIQRGDYIEWSPIYESSRGSDLETRSLFVNDKWDLNDRLSLNIGLRYDKNRSVDSGGVTRSTDSEYSPRLGATYDLLGDGRYRLSASYSRYVARLLETVANDASAGGVPSYFAYVYDGPTIRGLPTVDAFQAVWNWFQSVGGTSNVDLLAVGQVQGLNTFVTASLASPHADELSIGFGAPLGSSGFVRLDLIDREYGGFTQRRTDMTTGRVTDPFGTVLDAVMIENTDALRREYQGALLQSSYRFGPSLLVAGNYTWSETKGNGGGQWWGSASYPEYHAFAQNSPYGYLADDQRHKARAWAVWSIPFRGGLDVSLLQTYDSGQSYSLGAIINPRPYVKNPGYAIPPTEVAYYLSDRGALRWESITSTDLRLSYQVPFHGVQLWIGGDVMNLFGESAQISGDTTILTRRNGACVQTVGADAGKRCAAFDPFSETPVEGVHYVRSVRFGKATSPSDYQTPRTYALGVGVTF